MKNLDDLKAEYKDEGAILVKRLLNIGDLKDVEDKLLSEINKVFECECAQDSSWINYAIENPESVTAVYGEVANLQESVEIARNEKIKTIVQALIGDSARVYQKIPFRIDVPVETKELAVWHQDDFYVKGAPNEVTVWIPLQDVPMHLGALGVIKGSHKKGKIPHTVKWGKKMIPEGVFDSAVNIVEMNLGDVLFFDSYTLHTSNINFSDKIRYSLQLRFTSRELGEPSSIMGDIYEI